jgi:hypothetical protein
MKTKVTRQTQGLSFPLDLYINNHQGPCEIFSPVIFVLTMKYFKIENDFGKAVVKAFKSAKKDGILKVEKNHWVCEY